MGVLEWKPKRLDELGFVGRGKSRHRPRNDDRLYGGPYPFIQTAEIMAADPYIIRHSQSYSEFGLQQSKLWPKNTLCMTIAGANTAKTAILKIDACFPDSVVGFIPDSNKADLHYVKYALDLMKHSFLAVSRGATQDNLSLDKLLSFPILAPCVDEQRRIGAIFRTYDDLIENNTWRIQILEQMAQALYREWFVNFRFPGHEKVKLVDSPMGKIPLGWSVRRLDEVAAVNALTVRRGNEPSYILYVDIASVITGRIEKIEKMTFSDAPGRARRIVRHGDTIWSCVRPNRKSFSLILSPAADLIVSTGFAVLTPTSVPFSFLHQAVTTDDFVSYLTNSATGAAYPAVTGKDFEAAKLVIPDKVLLSRFHASCEPMLILKENLLRKNANLRRTRDLLLPKLISGAIDVPNWDLENL